MTTLRFYQKLNYWFGFYLDGKKLLEKRFRIAVLISGGGTTLNNLFKWIDRGDLDVDVGLVVSSTAKSKGITYATENNVPVTVVPKRKELTDQEYSDAIFEPIRQSKVNLVVMGGFLKHVLIPDDFENRVINIHPSLIPDFCGEGFYGMKVHQAVIQEGCKISGCTVHFVDNEYDHGPIIAQVTVPVEVGDTAETLQKRVFAQECEVYPQVIRQLSEVKVSKNQL
ncbi:MAG: phosphoribosylglycinamide formyltransferase [Planctomycetota bacterium]|nr:phosphoribosylglycinamide formyltransferase [Planctomycetota bacterium]